MGKLVVVAFTSESTGRIIDIVLSHTNLSVSIATYTMYFAGYLKCITSSTNDVSFNVKNCLPLYLNLFSFEVNHVTVK